MTRTLLYKGVYFAILFAGLALAFGLTLAFMGGRLSLRAVPIVVAAAVALLIPGRVLGYFWRDLLAGLRLLNSKDYAASKRHSERFLAEVREKPWLKNLIWLGTSSYSRDVEVMALNNLGAAELGLGEFEAARNHLAEAIVLDDKCPLPLLNMGALCLLSGAEDEAESWLRKAKALGLTGGLADRMVMSSQARFAEIEGALTAQPPPPAPP